MFLLVHGEDQVNHTVAISIFVIIPRKKYRFNTFQLKKIAKNLPSNKFDELLVKSNTGFGIENAAVGAGQEIR